MTKSQVQSITLSFVIHVLFVALFARLQSKQQNLNISPIEAQVSKTIKSYLYVTPEPVQLSDKRSDISSIQQIETPPTKRNIVAIKTQVKNKLTHDLSNPLRKKPTKIIMSNQVVHQASTNEKPLPQETPPQKSNTQRVNDTTLAAKALTQLQKKVLATIIEESSNQYIKQHMADKNKIDRSIASLNKKPEITTTQIDCGSDFNHNLVVISTILGGNLSCKKPPDIDKFIDARLESRGVKKKK
jgi:hypothetical protein